MRRLFSTFAKGLPGVGLLLMRVAAATTLLWHAVQSGGTSAAILSKAVSIALGLLMLAGLWTPFAGMLTALQALWNTFTLDQPLPWILLATIGLALALIGPGVWSVDARLFGWRRIEIPDRDEDHPPHL